MTLSLCIFIKHLIESCFTAKARQHNNLIMPGLGFISAFYEGKLRSKGILKVFDMKVDFEDYSSVSSGIKFQNISNDRLKILFQLFSSM